MINFNQLNRLFLIYNRYGDKMINKLIQFDLDEKLFREYYYLEKTAKNIQDFKLKYQDDAYNLNIVLNPEILQTHS